MYSRLEGSWAPNRLESQQLLEDIAVELDEGYGPVRPDRVLADFAEQTPSLSAGEQAELLGAVLESRRTGGGGQPSRGRGGFDWGGLARNVQQGLGAFQTGAQLVGQFAQMFGGRGNRTANSIAQWSNRLAQGAGVAQGVTGGVANLFGGHQPPRGLPGQEPQPVPPGAAPAPGRGIAPSPAPAGGGSGRDALGQFAALMGDPRVLQMLQSAAVLGQAATRGLEVEVPGPDGPRSVQIPAGPIVAGLASLANESLRELNALTREDDPDVPEYLVDDRGEFIVDPANQEERAALAVELLRADRDARRCVDCRALEDGLDESDAWARDAGFFG
ncbi:MAG: hypothetical protein JW940_35910 [Polyangiaceae bacterium]|nr:hypothetical protein [Polyangiaceae bacterium]